VVVCSRTAPALHVSRIDGNDSLQAAAGRTVVGVVRQLRDVFVVAEIALTVILLTAVAAPPKSVASSVCLSVFRPRARLAMEATPQNRRGEGVLYGAAQ